MTNTNLKAGMKETKEVILFAIALTHAIEKSLEDKEFTLADIPNFLPAFMKLIPAIDNISDVVVDLHAATEEDADEIKKLVRDELNLDDDKIESFVENAFAIALYILPLG